MYYSIIVPFFNEEATITHMFERLVPVCESLGSYEILSIDDGSSDRTFELLLAEKERNSNIKIIKFLKNAGQSDAFAAGFKEALGDIIITIDGDLQNPPEQIPSLIKALEKSDVAIGWRHKRQDSFSKKIASRFANKLRKSILDDDSHDTGCSLKAFKKDAAKSLKMYKGMHRFLPALSKIEGFSVSEVKVSHEDRKWGQTKYGTFRRGIPAFFDLLAVSWIKRRRLTYKIEKIY